ncbi:MAG: DUF1257 domain-containing protein [Microcoleus sp.]
MSHLTKIKTTIKNREVLGQVLNSMIQSNDILTNSTLEEHAIITDYFGKQATADFVIRRNRNKINDFGFVLNSKGEYEFISDNDARNKKEFLAQLMPWYARENAIASLISQGFEIESQIEEDGTVKIIAGKWA